MMLSVGTRSGSSWRRWTVVLARRGELCHALSSDGGVRFLRLNSRDYGLSTGRASPWASLCAFHGDLPVIVVYECA